MLNFGRTTYIYNMNKIATKDQFSAYQSLFDYLNDKLFNKELEDVLLNLGRRTKRTAGTFYHFRWQYDNEEKRHEISISPFIISEGKSSTIQTLTHEMCHLWQYQYGKHSKNGYHNKQWAKKMISLGLMPSDTGKEGGKMLGYSMSDYLIEGGLLDMVIKNMPDELWLPLTCLDAVQTVNLESLPEEVQLEIMEQEKRRIMKQKVVYKCPECNLKIWGKRDLSLRCNTCDTDLICTDSTAE